MKKRLIELGALVVVAAAIWYGYIFAGQTKKNYDFAPPPAPQEVISNTENVSNEDLGNVNNSFFATNYFIKDGQVFYEISKAIPGREGKSVALVGADYKTFEVIGRAYTPGMSLAKDSKEGIFCNDKRMSWDKASFGVYGYPQDSYYAHDKNNVYFDCKAVPDADTSSFAFIGLSGSDMPPYNIRAYSKDKNNAYLNGSKIENALPHMLTVMRNGYAHDTRSLYYLGKKVGGFISKIPAVSGRLLIVVREYFDNPSPSPAMLVFRESEDTQNLIDNIKLYYGYPNNLIAYKNKLYFLNEEGELAIYEPMSDKLFIPKVINDIRKAKLQEVFEEIKNTPTPLGESYIKIEQVPTTINSFHLADNKLFYLVGKNCNDYKASCELSLYVYNLDTEQNELVVNGVNSRYFIGYDKNLALLYLHYSDGDAGCGWGALEKINVATKSIIKVGTYSFCEGEDYDESTNSKDVYTQITSIENRLKNQRLGSDAVYFENGLIVLPQANVGEKCKYEECRILYSTD